MIAALWLAASILSCVVLILAVVREPQRMWIMDIVWPVTALWAGPLGAWGYFRFGRAGSKRAAMDAQAHHEEPPNKKQPFPVITAKGTTHCGAGCCLGDIVAELFAIVVPISLFGHKLFGSWLYDFILAFALGILFQYFTIKPMKHLDRKQGVIAALKADALSLSAWQIGMYGWMAIATFAIFHHELSKSSAVFWFMMQVAMAIGFLTAYPVNAWLIHKGLKERM